MFSQLPTPVLDPILSLSTAYRNDPREEKVDLGIGVYRNDAGETPIMSAIKQAHEQVLATQTTKSYVGLAGCEEFNHHITQLLFEGCDVFYRAATVQTPGASGALRILGDLIAVAQPETTVWLTNPSYVNHRPVMEAAGLKVRFYDYFSPETKQVDISRMLDALSHAGPKDVVLLHGCCHNPTGADIDLEAWKAVTALAQQKGFIPFVDIAYQGFGEGLAEDAAGLRWMADRVEEMFVTTSCSKNFGLYRERTGAAIVLGQSRLDADNAKGKILTLARATYTMPPDHGASLVKTVLKDAQLKQQWHQELDEMRTRLVSLRQLLCEQFRTVHQTTQFDFIAQHRGMFTMLGFTPQQMARLRQEFAIYAVDDSRINIAGMKAADIPYVAHAIAIVAQ